MLTTSPCPPLGMDPCGALYQGDSDREWAVACLLSWEHCKIIKRAGTAIVMSSNPDATTHMF